MLPRFSYTRPRSLKEAFEQLKSERSHIHAGGTDLLGCLHDAVFPADKVVSLSALSGLAGIELLGDGGCRIGALTAVSDIVAHPELQSRFAALPQAATEVASPQLRNQGTIGGNLCQKPRCWYYRGEFDCLRKGGPKCYAYKGQNQFHCILGGAGCYIVHPSDTAPALIALEARVRIAGPRGKRELAVEKLHVPPSEDPRRETFLEKDEIITAVLIPPPPERSSYRKVRARRSWDFAVTGVALALDLDGDRITKARVVLSGAAPIPWRSAEAEAELVGGPLSAERARKASQAAMADARPLEHNGYKVPMFTGLIEQELLKLAG